MEEQLTLRLPRTLARALARRARELGLPKSRVVREALARYMAGEPQSPSPAGRDSWERVQALVGSLELDRAAVERDRIARRIRRHNWRD
jgi:hypothetical protein